MRLLPRSSKAVCACMFVSLLAATATAPAAAEPGWMLPPSQLAPTLREPDSFAPPSAVIASGGEAAVVLVHWRPPESSVVSVERPAGGAWQAPVSIPGGAEGLAPQIAISPAGRQTAAWLDGASAGEERTVWVSRRRGGEAWAPATELPLFAPGDHVADGPAVAENEAGEAVVVWVEADSGYTSEWLVASRWQGGSWGAPQRISAPAEFVQLWEGPLVTAGSGGFLLGWIEAPSSGVYAVETDTLGAEGWTGEQAVESGPDRLYGVSLRANAAGQATMVWADAATESVHAASMQAGSWTVSNPAGTHIHVVCDQHPPRTAIDAAGEGQALWLETDGRMVSESVGPGGAWRGDRQVLTTIPESWYVMRMQLGVDDGGDALASWSAMESFSPPSSLVQGAAKAAGGTWEAPRTFVSGPGGYRSPTALAIGGDGSGVVSWLDEMEPGTSFEENEFTPRAVLYEGAKPAAGPGPQPAAATAPSGRRALGSVYLLAPKSHLWLRHGRHAVTVPIRNTNPFPVSGAVRLYEYLIPGRAHTATLALSELVHYRLAAHQTSSVSFRLARRALRRLRAYVPDRGHILVQARLSVAGEGQTASSSVVMALDQRMRRHLHRKPHVPSGYPAPVDPWAHRAC